MFWDVYIIVYIIGEVPGLGKSKWGEQLQVYLLITLDHHDDELKINLLRNRLSAVIVTWQRESLNHFPRGFGQ